VGKEIRFLTWFEGRYGRRGFEDLISMGIELQREVADS